MLIRRARHFRLAATRVFGARAALTGTSHESWPGAGRRAVSLTSPPCMRRTSRLALLGSRLALAGCGGRRTTCSCTRRRPAVGSRRARPKRRSSSASRRSPPRTRRASPGADPVADAAGVALAVYPSAAPGTHPTRRHARADRRLAGRDRRVGADGAADPRADAALGSDLAAVRDRGRADRARARPASGASGGAQVIRIGDVPAPAGLHAGGDQRHRPLHAGGGDRPLRQRRRRARPSATW